MTVIVWLVGPNVTRIGHKETSRCGCERLLRNKPPSAVSAGQAVQIGDSLTSAELLPALSAFLSFVP